MISLRAVVLAILVLVLITAPQIRGSGLCMPTEPSAGADSPDHHPTTPSTDCDSNTHPAPSFATHCTDCGAALLADGLFPLEEASWNLWSAVESMASLCLPSPRWRPPA